MITDHPQTHITLNGREADVDVGMAELILACWRQGIDTMLSCQGEARGRASNHVPLRRRRNAIPRARRAQRQLRRDWKASSALSCAQCKSPSTCYGIDKPPP
jgi:hypothetical protein